MEAIFLDLHGLLQINLGRMLNITPKLQIKVEV